LRSSKLKEEDKKTIKEAADEAIEFLDSNSDADVDAMKVRACPPTSCLLCFVVGWFVRFV
jgi:hypothetical protein